jgi:hypothetical protein
MGLIKVKQVVVDGKVVAEGPFGVWPKSVFAIKFRNGEVLFRVKSIADGNAYCEVVPSEDESEVRAAS